jgi:hypothetical protein
MKKIVPSARTDIIAAWTQPPAPRARIMPSLYAHTHTDACKTVLEQARHWWLNHTVSLKNKDQKTRNKQFAASVPVRHEIRNLRKKT